MAEQGGGVDVSSLTIEQLGKVKESFEQELDRYGESFGQLQGAANLFHSSGLSCEGLAEEEEDKPMLIPLTSSLYVSGKTGPTDKLLVDIGTGYFIEKTPAESAEFCKRKVRMLKDNMQSLHEVISGKKQQLMQVQQVMQAKMQAAQQAQEKQAKQVI